MRTWSITAAALAGMTVAASALGQVSIGPNGIRSGNTVIDAGGVHANGTEVTGRGVHVGGGHGTVIRGNGGHRRVDCGGGELAVEGNANHLSVNDCRRR